MLFHNVLLTLLTTVKNWRQMQLKGKKLYSGSWFECIVSGKALWWEPEAVVHITPTARKQRGVNTGA